MDNPADKKQNQKHSTRQKLLEMLQMQQGLPLSGTCAAKKLTVSRTAIWKAVCALRKEGCAIEGETRRGYTLRDGNLPLDAAKIIEMLLPATSNFVGGKLEVFKTIDSTNTEARRRLGANSQVQNLHGSVIIAEHQSAGRGRLGRSFYSPKNAGIYLSIIFCPAQNTNSPDPSLITALSAAALCRVFLRLGLDPKIKWVNDIFINKKKVCGILTEAFLNMEQRSFETVILGIGINVSQSLGGFPPELQNIASTLTDTVALHKTDSQAQTSDPSPINRNKLAADMLNEVFAALSGKTYFKTLMGEYRERSLVLGKKVEVITPKETYTALVLDITEQARLIIEDEKGQQKELLSGEVSLKLQF